MHLFWISWAQITVPAHQLSAREANLYHPPQGTTAVPYSATAMCMLWYRINAFCRFGAESTETCTNLWLDIISRCISLSGNMKTVVDGRVLLRGVVLPFLPVRLYHFPTLSLHCPPPPPPLLLSKISSSNVSWKISVILTTYHKPAHWVEEIHCNPVLGTLCGSKTARSPDTALSQGTSIKPEHTRKVQLNRIA